MLYHICNDTHLFAEYMEFDILVTVFIEYINSFMVLESLNHINNGTQN